jgi:hypothetical protein
VASDTASPTAQRISLGRSDVPAKAASRPFRGVLPFPALPHSCLPSARFRANERPSSQNEIWAARRTTRAARFPPLSGCLPCACGVGMPVCSWRGASEQAEKKDLKYREMIRPRGQPRRAFMVRSYRAVRLGHRTNAHGLVWLARTRAPERKRQSWSVPVSQPPLDILISIRGPIPPLWTCISSAGYWIPCVALRTQVIDNGDRAIEVWTSSPAGAPYAPPTIIRSTSMSRKRDGKDLFAPSPDDDPRRVTSGWWT